MAERIDVPFGVETLGAHKEDFIRLRSQSPYGEGEEECGNVAHCILPYTNSAVLTHLHPSDGGTVDAAIATAL